MTSEDHKVEWIDPRTGFGYYDDNSTRPERCVPVMDETAQTIYLSAAEWAWLQAELDKPAEPISALVELFKKHRWRNAQREDSNDAPV